MNKNFFDKSCGSMIGLAIGDALGASVEFMPRGSFKPIVSYRDGGKFNLSAGDYTDDTAMALCLADSLIRNNGTNLQHQLANYTKWLNEGFMSSTGGKAVGCGKNTFLSILAYMKTSQVKASSTKNKKRVGNGSLMRIAPISIFYRNDLFSAMSTTNESSYTTHALQICADACMVYTTLIYGVLNSASKEEILSQNTANCILNNVIDNYEFDKNIAHILCGSYKKKAINDIKSGGYVANSLEAALWCFYTTNSFKEGVLKAVNLGYDSDTVGAIYGMLAGAYYGLSDSDKDFKENLTNFDLIYTIAKKLIERSKKCNSIDVNGGVKIGRYNILKDL